MLQELICIFPILWQKGDAHASTDVYDGTVSKRERRVDLLDDVLGNSGSISLMRDLFQNDDELVSPETSQHIGVPQAGAEPSRDCLQEFVASRMSERIVNQLESVEIDKQDRSGDIFPKTIVHMLQPRHQ